MNIFLIFGLYSCIIIIQLSRSSKARKKDIFTIVFIYNLGKVILWAVCYYKFITKLIFIMLSVKDQTAADFLDYYFDRIAKHFIISGI